MAIVQSPHFIRDFDTQKEAESYGKTFERITGLKYEVIPHTVYAVNLIEEKNYG